MYTAQELSSFHKKERLRKIIKTLTSSTGYDPEYPPVDLSAVEALDDAGVDKILVKVWKVLKQVEEK